jgi:hypothetical protein
VYRCPGLIVRPPLHEKGRALTVTRGCVV